MFHPNLWNLLFGENKFLICTTVGTKFVSPSGLKKCGGWKRTEKSLSFSLEALQNYHQ